MSGSDIILMENDWRSYTVRLASQPLTDVTVILSPHEDYYKKVHVQWASSSDTTTFTAENWNTPQTVQVWGWGDYNEVTDTEVITHVAWDAGQSPTVARLWASIQDQTGPAVTLPTPTATPVATATPAPKVSIIITVPDEHLQRNRDSGGSVHDDMRVAKGGSATFSVRLGSKPTADVPVELYEYGDSLGTIHYTPWRVTFTPDSWNTDQTITVSSSNTPAGRSGNSASLLIRTGDTDDTSGYYNLPWVWQRVYEIEPPAVRLQPSAITVDEGSSHSYSVWLNTQPTADVTVTIAGGSGDSDLTASPATLTFTTANWDYPQSARVSAAQDDDLANASRTINHTASGGDYAGLSASLTATEREDDSASIVVSATSVSVPEGATAGYNVRLSNEPSGDVTVTLSATGDDDITLSTASLDFTSSNWRVAQTVTLTAAQDTDDLNGTKAIRHTASGADFGGAPAVAVTATEADDDRRGLAVKRPGWPLTINPTTWDPVIAEGGSYSYTVKLGTAPSSDVTIALSASGDSDVTVAPASLTFNANNYANAQTVTISAAHDDNDYLDDTATVSHTVSSSDPIYVEQTIGDVAVSVDDDDAGVILSRSAVVIMEGNSATYNVKLTNKPTAEVTVTIAEGTASPNDDTSIRVSSPSNKKLTFTENNWDTPQTVRLRANSDSDRNANNHEFNGTRAITHTASGATEFVGVSSSLIATERDSQARVLTRNSANSNISSLTVVEESTATYAVSLNAQPAANVTVAIAEATSGSYTDADITVASSKTLTFTSQNYATAQTVTLSAAADNDLADGRRTITHTASDAGSTYSGYGVVNNAVITRDITAREDDNDTGGLEFADSSDNAITAISVPENGSAAYKLRLTHKPNGNVNVSARGATGGENDTDISVRDTNDSQNGNQTGSIRFTPNNWDAYRSVTLAAADDADSENGSRTINHTANGGGYSNITGSLTATEAEDDFAITIAPAGGLSVPEGGSATYTVRLTSAPSSDVTVTIAEGTETGYDADITVTSPASKTLTFTSLNYATAQTVTLSAAEDDTDTQNGSRTISHSATSADANYNGLSASLVATEAENEKAIILSHGSLTVPEGRSATFDVSLSVQPTDDVTVTIAVTGDLSFKVTNPVSKRLTFTSQNYSTPQTVTLYATPDTDSVNGIAVLTLTADSHDHDYEDLTAELRAYEREFVITLDPATGLSVPEGGTATYTVSLNIRPTSNVTVRISEGTTAPNNDTSIRVSSPSSKRLTFTSQNYATPQTVTLRAAQDSDSATGLRGFSHTASGGGYDNASAVTLLASEVEDDYAIQISSPTGVSVPESGMATYTVELSRAPTADVTVTIAEGAGDADITVTSPSNKTLTFTSQNWNIAQTVTLSAAFDYGWESGSRTISHTAASADNNYNSATVSLTASEADDTVIGFTSYLYRNSPDFPGLMRLREGTEYNNARYSVFLRNRPTAEVTVKVTAQNTVPGASLQFRAGNILTNTLVFDATDYFQPKPVFANFRPDNNADAGSVVLSHTASGGGYDNAAVAKQTLREIEPPLTLSISELTISEGGTATYTVALSENTGNLEDHRVTLSYAPGGDSTITFDTDPDTTGNQNTLFFHLCCHTTPQTVTVSSLDDNKPVANPSRTILHKVSTYHNHSKTLETIKGWVNATGPSLTVKKIENDQSIFFDPPRTQGLTVPEGGSATTTVTISVPPSAGATTTVTISESTTAPHNDTDITVTSPSNKQLHFTAQNYSTPQTVTFSAASDEDLVHGTRIFTFRVSGVGYSISSPYKTIERDTTVGLTASGIGTSTATLGLVNHSGNHSGAWWYKRTAPTGDDTCHSVANATTTPTLSGLSTSTTYTYKAYDATNCANADVMASETFTTLASESTLTATSTTATTARLDIAGYTGSGWYYKYTSPTGGQCSSSAVTATTTRATGLATSTSFTFGAYSDSGCLSLLATSNEVTTWTPYMAHLAVQNGVIIIALRNWNAWSERDGTWYYKHITPPENECNGPTSGNTSVSGHTAGTDYTFGTYTDSGCTKLIATTSPITAKSASQASASPGPVASVTASRSGGGIVAGWDAVVNATKYHVTYSTDGGASWSLAADAHQSNSITIANADDGLAYIVGVRAGNDAGWGPWTNSNTVPAGDGASISPPVDIGGPSLTVSDSGSASWSYTAPEGAKYVYTEIRWLETAERKPNDWDGKRNAVFYDSGVTAHDIPDLTAGVEYKAKIFVRLKVDGENRYAKSNTVVFTPPSSPPDAVASVMAVHKGESVAAAWRSADGAAGYDVVYSTDGGASWTRAATNQAETSYTLTRADSAKTYVIGVRAVNDAGESAWTNSPPASPSEDQAFTTGQ